MKDNKNSSEVIINKHYNPQDVDSRNELRNLMLQAPIPEDELFNNIGLFIDRRTLSRFLFINELYQKILQIHGNVFEFGVRYGQNISLFTSLRGIYEPFNHNRKIIGFDTWEGFSSFDSKNDPKNWKNGDFSVPNNYDFFLEKVISVHEKMAPIENIKKHKLIKGDAVETISKYLNSHQETIISLAYFDFDIYKPTKKCLEEIIPYLSKGAIIAFDEINVEEFPGETKAFREVLGTNKFKIIHSAFRSNAGYIVFE